MEATRGVQVKAKLEAIEIKGEAVLDMVLEAEEILEGADREAEVVVVELIIEMKEKEVKQAKEVLVSEEVSIVINVVVLMTQEEQEEALEMIEGPEEVGKKGVALLLAAVVEVQIQPIQKAQSLNNLRIEELAPGMPHETLFVKLVEVVEDMAEMPKAMIKVTTKLHPVEEGEVTKVGAAEVMATGKWTVKADAEAGIRAVEGGQIEIPTMK